MKIFKYLLFSGLFLISNDSLGAAAAPVANVLSKVELEAIRMGDLEVIKTIVETKGMKITDESGNPILCVVLDMSQIEADLDSKILKAKLDAAKWLIEHDANIEGRNEFGLTPFLIVVNKFMPCLNPFVGDMHVVSYEFNQLRFDFIEFLKGRNADLNAADSEHYEVEDNVIASGGDRRNFLMYAIENGDTALVERLCSLGVITQVMYEAAIEVYQKNSKANAARPSWVEAVSLPANAQGPVKAPNSESAAGYVGADMAAGDSAQKEAIAVMTNYFSYQEGRELIVRVVPSMEGINRYDVKPLAALVASYVVSPMVKTVSAAATSEVDNT